MYNISKSFCNMSFPCSSLYKFFVEKAIPFPDFYIPCSRLIIMVTNITFEYEYLMSLLCDWFEIYKIDQFSGYLPVVQIFRTSPDKHKENICYFLFI